MLWPANSFKTLRWLIVYWNRLMRFAHHFTLHCFHLLFASILSSSRHRPLFLTHFSLPTLPLSSIFLSSFSSSSFARLPSSFSSSLSSSAIQLNLEVTTVAGWHQGLNKSRTIASPLLSSSHPLISPFNRLPLFSPFTVALSGSLLAMLMKEGLVWV